MKKLIAAFLTLPLLMPQPAFGMESPVSDPVFTTKTTTLVVSSAAASKIKRAVGSAAISVDCQAGLKAGANSRQIRVATRLAKKVCAQAIKSSPNAAVTSGALEASGSAVGKVTLSIVANDVPKDYPKISFDASWGATIGFGMYLLSASIPANPKAGGSSANPVTVSGKFYLCPTALPKAASEHSAAATWAGCAPMTMTLGTTYRVKQSEINKYIRLVITAENALGRDYSVEEFLVFTP